MTFIDKFNLLEERLAKGSLSLELGVGSKKNCSEALGIDKIDTPACDIVGDVAEVLASLPDSSVHYVYASHFVEHIEYVDHFLSSLLRVCAPNAEIVLIAPHFSNPFFYSDPTHRASYGLYTFGYYCNIAKFSRTIPSYSRIKGLELANVSLLFGSYPPNYFRHIVKKVIEKLVNSSYWAKELYEECFCWFAPCYEVRNVLLGTKSSSLND